MIGPRGACPSLRREPGPGAAHSERKPASSRTGPPSARSPLEGPCPTKPPDQRPQDLWRQISGARRPQDLHAAGPERSSDLRGTPPPQQTIEDFAGFSACAGPDHLAKPHDLAPVAEVQRGAATPPHQVHPLPACPRGRAPSPPATVTHECLTPRRPPGHASVHEDSLWSPGRLTRAAAVRMSPASLRRPVGGEAGGA